VQSEKSEKNNGNPKNLTRILEIPKI
jgi:hypothetical protein